MKIIGHSDTFTSCDCCGRKGLKKTIMLSDSNGAIFHCGTSCAAMAVHGWKGASINNQVRKEAVEAQLRTERHERSRNAWVNDANEALIRMNNGAFWQTDPLLKRFHQAYASVYDVFNRGPNFVTWRAWLEAQAAGAESWKLV